MKKRLRLSNLTSYSKGQQINGDELLVDGEYDYLNGGICPSGTWNDFNTEANSIAISEGGNSCGFVNFMVKPFWCGAHCYFLHNTEGIPKYLYYALKSQQERLMKIRSGACMPNIKKAALGKFELFYDDDLDEQNKIVEVLENTEKVIEKRKKELIALDSIVQARFVEMFGDIPNNKYVKMKKVCSIITDGTHQPPKFESRGIPFLFVSNLSNNEMTYTAEKFIGMDTYKELYKRTPVEIGDVLLTIVGSYGHVAVVKSNKKFLFQRHIAYLKPNNCIINSEYLRGALLAPNGQREIKSRVKGVAQQTLNLSEIKEMMIPLPKLELQNKFADFVQQVDKSKDAIQKSLDETQLLFDSLMQKYFG